MIERPAVARPPLETWHSESLRLTAFSRSPVGFQVTWWNDLFGAPAETITSNPRQGIHQEQGTVDEALFTLRIDGTPRVDWAMSALPTADQTSLPPEIGLLPDVTQIFRARMHTWLGLQTLPTLWRLAFGAVGWQPVNSLESGYQFLENYLPHARINFAGMSDFFLQINRSVPSTSGIDGLRINRLSKWMVARVDTLLVRAGATADVQAQQGYAVRVELDVNTSPGHQGDLPRDALPRIMDECVELALQIYREGDTL